MTAGSARSLRVQLWSCQYHPEPTGIGPVCRAVATALSDRGHEVGIVAAYPHYPEPAWGARRWPDRELCDGLPVIRVPIWPGRQTVRGRLRQEATFTAALSAASPMVRTPDVIVAVSPSFPALLPAMANARVRRIPWVMWLQDILPDAAVVTGLLDEDRLVVRAARRFERAAYRSAARVVVISETFRDNLGGKGVPDAHLVRIYNPATRPVRAEARDPAVVDDRLALSMGNIGHSQNLSVVVQVFEGSAELESRGVRFVMAGDGVNGDQVRDTITTDRVRVTGILGTEELDGLLRQAAVGVVTQHPRDHDFNVPSKLMNFMGAGIPVVASVDSNSEVARILNESGGGWVTNSRRLAEEFPPALLEAISDADERERRGASALAFAQAYFDPAGIAERFERVLLDAVGR